MSTYLFEAASRLFQIHKLFVDISRLIIVGDPTEKVAFAVLDELVRKGDVQMNYETAEKNYIKAIRKGLFKIMSKMGISTIRSYRGAKIFEAVGVSEELLRSYLIIVKLTPFSTTIQIFSIICNLLKTRQKLNAMLMKV